MQKQLESSDASERDFLNNRGHYNNILQPNNSNRNPISSDHLQEYIQRLSIFPEGQGSSLNNPYEQYKTWKMYNLKHIFTSKLVIQEMQKTKHNQVVTLKVWLGYCRFKVFVLFVQDSSQYHLLRHTWQGNYGSVYKIQALNRALVVKCLKYKQQHFAQIFYAALEELSFVIIGSQEQFGPHYPLDSIGFDLIVYKECIEFMMENCEMKAQIDLQRLDADLKQDLLKMHSLNMVHSDIKETNIGYSPNFKKYVFIDFGISSILPEHLGEKSMTYFKGSYNYCSEQMKQCYFQREKRKPVDMYYNDAVCLNVVLKRMSMMKVQQSEHQSFQVMYEPDVDYSLAQVLNLAKRYILGNNSPEAIVELYKTYKFNILKHKQEIISFVWENYHKLCYRDLARYLQTSKYDEEQPFLKILKAKDNTNYVDQTVNQYTFFTVSFAKLKEKFRKIQPKQYRYNLYSQNITVADLKTLISEKHENGYSKEYMVWLSWAFDITSVLISHKHKLQLAKKMIKDLSLNKIAQKPLQICLLKLFSFSIQKIQSHSKQIIKNILNSLVILELISQEKLIWVFEIFLNSTLRKREKGELTICFFVATQWIGWKTVTKYKYEQILQSLLEIVTKFIKSYAQRDLYDLELQLLQLIVQKMPKRLEFIWLPKLFQLDKKLLTLLNTKSRQIKKITYCKQLYIFIMYITKGDHLGENYLAFYHQNHTNSFKYQHLFLYTYFMERRQNQYADHLFSMFRKTFHFLDYKSFYINYRPQIGNNLQVKTNRTKAKVRQVCARMRNSTAYHKMLFISQYAGLFRIFAKHPDIQTQPWQKVKAQLIQELTAALEQIEPYTTSQNKIYQHFKAGFVYHMLDIIDIKSSLMEQALTQAHFQVISNKISTYTCINCKVQALIYLDHARIVVMRSQGRYEQCLRRLIDGIFFFVKPMISIGKNQRLYIAQLFQLCKLKNYSSQLLEVFNCLIQIKAFNSLLLKDFSNCIFYLYFYLLNLGRSQQALGVISIILGHLSTLGSNSYTMSFIFQFNRIWSYDFLSMELAQYLHQTISNPNITVSRKAKQINSKYLLDAHLNLCRQLFPLDYPYKALVYCLVFNKMTDINKITKGGSTFFLFEMAKNMQRLDEKAYNYIISRYYFFCILCFEAYGRRRNYLLTKALKKQYEETDFVWKIRRGKKRSPFHDRIRTFLEKYKTNSKKT